MKRIILNLSLLIVLMSACSSEKVVNMRDYGIVPDTKENLSSKMQEDTLKEKALLDDLIGKLCKLNGVVINGAHDAPHILSLSIPGVPTQNTINILQDAGICVSAGSACAKGHRSHVLTAMKLSPEIMDGSFRISLSRETSEQEIDLFLDTLTQKIIPMARR